MHVYESKIGRLREAGHDVWVGGAQSDEAIAELEQALSITLPPSYRQFLSQIGGLSVDDWFVSGILDQQPLGEGAGWLYADTLRFREEFQLPEHLLVVQPDEDAPYCLDTSASGANGEYPVVCYELHSGHTERIAPTFAAWFEQWLQSRTA